MHNVKITVINNRILHNSLKMESNKWFQKQNFNAYFIDLLNLENKSCPIVSIGNSVVTECSSQTIK